MILNTIASYSRLIIRMFLLFSWMVIVPSVFVLARLLRIKGHDNIVHWFHAGCRRILGLNVQFSGEICQQQSMLYVSNHISYLDVFVLGDIRGYFIAKSEVASWPVLGWFARFQNTLFFERRAGQAKHQLKLMQQHLKTGRRLILFPEGTSTDGVHVEPFKSSLFESANIDTLKVSIQPITITYTHYDGQLITDQKIMDNYAWYADMTFGGHFWNVLKLKKAGIKVHFHEPCYLNQFDSRKQCADHCQVLVADKMTEFLQTD